MMASALLSVMLLLEPEEIVNAEMSASVSVDADRIDEIQDRRIEGPKHARITAERSDFDRAEGVAVFSGGVMIEYDRDFTMNADRLFIFANGTNELSRVVAVGNVVITNDVRVGSCATAVYRRKTGEIEMYGDNNGLTASFADAGDSGNDVEGLSIKFWIDSEQIEVENPVIRVNRSGKGIVL